MDLLALGLIEQAQVDVPGGTVQPLASTGEFPLTRGTLKLHNVFVARAIPTSSNSR